MSDITLGAVMVIAIGGILLYFPLNRIRAPGRWFFHDTWLDFHIPLVPYFVIPYVTLFPYLAATAIILFFSDFAAAFYTAVAVAAWSAALIWYFFPAGILRKRQIGLDFFSRMIVWIYEHDEENNTFPSSHVFYAIICSYFLALVFPPYTILFAVIGFLIAISTVLVKQHHVADIVGGMIWAIGSIWIAHVLVV
jgi:membrane-associated phospholipid phosphatase